MQIEAVHPGVSVEQVREQHRVRPAHGADITVTEAPSADELALLRALDPERRFLG